MWTCARQSKQESASSGCLANPWSSPRLHATRSSVLMWTIWRMNFWTAGGVRHVSDFRAYEHFGNFYLFRNYQMNRTLVKRFLAKNVCCAIMRLAK